MPLGVADLVLTRSATEGPLGGAAFSLAFSRLVLGALGGGLFGGGPFGGVGPATREDDAATFGGTLFSLVAALPYNFAGVAADGFPAFFAGGGPTRALSVAFGGPALGGDGVRPLESPSRGGNSPR